MSKPNDQCPCGSEKKYKKCCKAKGLYTKKSELPSMWKNLGKSHPSFRFSIGDRIEAKSMKEMYAKWIPGTVRGFIVAGGGYDILLDYPDSGMSLDCELPDKNRFVRPLGFTKSPTYLTDPCGLCGASEPTEGISTFLQCGGCRRKRYCTPKCGKKDWKKHRVLCQAIVTQNKKVLIQIKELIKSGTPEAIHDVLGQSIVDDDHIIIRKILKKKEMILMSTIKKKI